jgi:L-lactate utilization protein LutC
MSFFKKLFGKSSTEASEVKKQEVKLSLDDLFVHNFVNKGGKFLYCIQEKEITKNLNKILLENNWKELSILDDSILTFINQDQISVTDKSNLMAPVFTTCEHLIADNGDILFSSNQLSSTKLNNFSENFIVFATTSQIVKNTGQGLTGIKAHAKGSLPTNISAIKDYQIHKSDDSFLNYGNSNSKNLYLLLLENL